MGYFPFFMDVSQLEGVVIGGGSVATRKVQQLLQFGAGGHLKVVTWEASEELLKLQEQGEIILLFRSFEVGDLVQVDYVVSASSDAELNGIVSECCKKRRIPVNVVDVKEECTFLFPSIVQDGCITAGISTGGSSPYLAKYLKTKVREAIPVGIGEIAEMLGNFRPMVKERIRSQKVREKIFTELAELVVGKEHVLSEEEVDQVIGKYEKE